MSILSDIRKKSSNNYITLQSAYLNELNEAYNNFIKKIHLRAEGGMTNAIIFLDPSKLINIQNDSDYKYFIENELSIRVLFIKYIVDKLYLEGFNCEINPKDGSSSIRIISLNNNIINIKSDVINVSWDYKYPFFIFIKSYQFKEILNKNKNIFVNFIIISLFFIYFLLVKNSKDYWLAIILALISFLTSFKNDKFKYINIEKE